MKSIKMRLPCLSPRAIASKRDAPFVVPGTAPLAPVSSTGGPRHPCEGTSPRRKPGRGPTGRGHATLPATALQDSHTPPPGSEYPFGVLEQRMGRLRMNSLRCDCLALSTVRKAAAASPVVVMADVGRRHDANNNRAIGAGEVITAAPGAAPHTLYPPAPTGRKQPGRAPLRCGALPLPGPLCLPTRS